ncbi:hypothetical protein BV25DRAFT_1922005 [Artomyces pyxidatus]|uniref:Uncharacterized protein n=1 Tax=Artomyces pyxidatus TaxID=48021 RepID=A0ACB8SHL5_9AGAM|nr:hypothetical protein BV25DRAFT_1922005 [Artomyces pyxidatus]
MRRWADSPLKTWCDAKPIIRTKLPYREFLKNAETLDDRLALLQDHARQHGEEFDDSAFNPSMSTPPPSANGAQLPAGARGVDAPAAKFRGLPHGALSGSKGRAAHLRALNSGKRVLKHQADSASRKPSRQVHREAFVARHASPPLIIADDYDAAVFAVTKPGYTLKRVVNLADAPANSVELDEDGFSYFKWDGRTSYLIIEAEDRIIAALVSTPDESKPRAVARLDGPRRVASGGAAGLHGAAGDP